jgi:hypothetical protein
VEPDAADDCPDSWRATADTPFHPSFAMMHAAIYDAVNNIDKTHSPYLVRLRGVSLTRRRRLPPLPQPIAFYSACTQRVQASLDAQLQQALAQIPDGPNNSEGIREA